jgi:phenylalanyl-tRNA synthetase beta chain
MKISMNWLREYVDVDLPVRELVDRLTMIGLVCETWESRGDDAVLDLETYANRPDTLGHLGVARELAAALGLPLKEPAWPLVHLPEPTSCLAEVQIDDPDLCPRYTGLVVRGVKIGPSPEALRKKIEAMGLRSTSNIVDVSNVVLFATGHPIHAFDLGRLSGGRIVIRRARKGESIRTLDGKQVALAPEMLVIADEKRPVAIAGVMGGEETGITENTQDVFIESAVFDPVSIRLTRRALDLQTDASYRYERGVDIAFAPQAAVMAASLMAQFGGRVSQGILDVYPKPRKPKEIVLRAKRVSDLLGVAVEPGFIEKTLADLGFGLKVKSQGHWHVAVPSFRVDIEREADLVEEVARFFGYDKIPSILPSFEVLDPIPSEKDRIDRLSTQLFHHGFDEVVNQSFADPEREAAFITDAAPVALRNPFSVHASVLRTSLVPGLLQNAAHNRNRGAEGVHVFEVGNVYFRPGETGAVEECRLGLLSTGPLGGPHWKVKPEQTSVHRLKGAVEAAFEALRYTPLAFERAGHPFFEEGAAVAVVYKGERIGILGRVRASLLALDEIKGPVFAAEISLGWLLAKQPLPFAYAPLPKLPAVVRDLSFLVDRARPYQEIRLAVERTSAPHLESFDVVDRYDGPNVPEGLTSLTLRFVFRSPKATLQAEEVDRSERKIVKALKTAFEIRLREGGTRDD